MTLKFLAIALLSAVAACQSPGRDPDPATAINAAYERGKTSGARPGTVEQKWTCSASWYVWSQMVEESFAEPLRTQLTPELAKPWAMEMAGHWEREATSYLGMAPLDPELERFIDGQVAETEALGKSIVAGDDYALAERLGSCAAPPAD